MSTVITTRIGKALDDAGVSIEIPAGNIISAMPDEAPLTMILNPVAEVPNLVAVLFVQVPAPPPPIPAP